MAPRWAPASAGRKRVSPGYWPMAEPFHGSDLGIAGETSRWPNFFQCFAIGLTAGANAITLHAVDLAGNQSATTLSVTLNILNIPYLRE